MNRTILTILFIALCTGCSTTQSQKPRLPSVDSLLLQMTEQDGRACIRSGDMNGFAALDDDIVSVNARRKKHYLITTTYSCHSLGSSFSLGLSGTFSEVCGGGASNQLITRDEACPIKHIFVFESREDALATYEMVKGRREAMAQFPAAQPQ